MRRQSQQLHGGADDQWDLRIDPGGTSDAARFDQILEQGDDGLAEVDGAGVRDLGVVLNRER